ncbi:MAG: NHLP family bacteriocin export ABC transporter peptidase/permease/ATPase [Rhodothalassiaceae bacterium]|nr:MAG: NHLP family bacteriocin export ABC transporter peptidase/permease/ATPase [Rhodothalassiaceae bacterium]
MTAIAVASLLIAAPGLVTPLGLKLFVDDVLVRGYADWLFPLVLGLVVAALAGGFLAWFQQRLLVALQTKLDMAIAAEYVWHLLRLPMRFFGQRLAGDLANRMVGARRIAALMAGPLPTTVIAMMVGAVFLTALFFLSPWLTLVALAAMGLHLGVLKLVARRRQELNSRYLMDQGALAGFSAAGLSAIETIRAGGSEQDFYAQWAGHHARLVNSHQRLGEASALLEVGPQFVAVLAHAVILFAGAELILAGRLTMGGLVAFQALWMQVATPVQRFVMLGGQLQTILGDLMRLDDVLRYPLDEGEAAVPRSEPSGPRGEPQPVRITGRLEFRGVSFGYDPTRPPLIDGLDFVLPPGGRIALVGPSGSGKSTVARLILGLLRPSAGEILIDGRPRDAWPAILLERDIAAVDQEIFLFAGTVAENIAFRDPDLRHEAIRRAAEDALIHDEIAARPGGYEAVVEEGGRNFSGGQRQRLEIARALARDPRILVLDEATAALDAKTEEEIDHRLRRRGCSLVIVAHRLSTIRDADEIILLDEGRVAERGRHADLIALGGRYRQLVEQG